MPPTAADRLVSFNSASHRSIYNFFLITHLLLMLPQNTILWTAEAFPIEESNNELVNGKVIRVLVFTVPNNKTIKSVLVL